MRDTCCCICRDFSRPVMTDAGPQGDIVDSYVFDFDGSLDYIELMHRECAEREGYQIDAEGHVVPTPAPVDRGYGEFAS